MKRILAMTMALWLFSATFAFAVPRHTGPTKQTVYSYNKSYGKEPIIGQIVSQSPPSKPPVVIVKVSVGELCLQLELVNGVPAWRACP